MGQNLGGLDRLRGGETGGGGGPGTQDGMWRSRG